MDLRAGSCATSQLVLFSGASVGSLFLSGVDGRLPLSMYEYIGLQLVIEMLK